jgi:hypothetical protein
MVIPPVIPTVIAIPWRPAVAIPIAVSQSFTACNDADAGGSQKR